MLEIKCKEHLVHKCTILMAILIILLCLHPMLGQNWTFSGTGPTQKLFSMSLGMIYNGTIAQNYRLLTSRQYRQEYITFTL